MTNQSKKYPVKDYLLYLLSRRDYSTAELLFKALQKGHDGVDTKSVITELTEAGLINDLRMAQNLILNYQGYKGKTWIKQKLLLKKIPFTIVEILLSDNEDLNEANEIFRRKVMQKYNITSWKNVDPKTNQKILNYMARQGFSNPWKLLSEWSENEQI